MILELAPKVEIEDTYSLPHHSATICCTTPDNRIAALLYQFRPEWKCWVEYSPWPMYAEPKDVTGDFVQEKLEEFASEYNSQILSDYVINVEKHITALVLKLIEPTENEL